MSDQIRVDAAAKAIYLRNNPEGNWDEHSRIFKDAYRRHNVEPLLDAVDAVDREAGIHRVQVDYSTVMQIDSILRAPRTDNELLHEYQERRMREVLAALTGATA